MGFHNQERLHEEIARPRAAATTIGLLGPSGYVHGIVTVAFARLRLSYAFASLAAVGAIGSVAAVAGWP